MDINTAIEIAFNTIKNESDINQGNACKDKMSNNMDHHVDNANSYHLLKDTDTDKVQMDNASGNSVSSAFICLLVCTLVRGTPRYCYKMLQQI